MEKRLARGSRAAEIFSKILNAKKIKGSVKHQGEFRRITNEELENLYKKPSIVLVVKVHGWATYQEYLSKDGYEEF